MTAVAILLASFASILAVFLTGLPVFVAFMLLNIAGVWFYFSGPGFGMLTNSMYETLSSPTLVALPMFILMGEILFRSGVTDILYRALDVLLGRSRLRLYYLSILLSTTFGALSGAAMAVVAMMGRTLYPGMLARGYDRRLTAGTIMAGASLAPIIPPSVLAVIIASLANISVAGLLIAGVLPGLMLAALFLIYVVSAVAIDPDRAPTVADGRQSVTWGQRARAVLLTLPFGLVILSVLGVILAGIVTPEESAATGVLGALLVSVVFGKLSMRTLFEAVAVSARTTAIVLLIMMSSKMFGQLLAFSGATQSLIDTVSGLDIDPWLMLAILMAIPFVICMFLDSIAVMLILVPIYIPIVGHFQYDVIWFWALFLINITVGGITPPFGYTIFAFKSAVPDLPMREIYAAAWPYVGVFLVGMLLVVLFPALATYLPKLV
ncbi:MAG: TRAP transporter large permease [Alphaproteobacteria bacterium]|nr:TRAP transporter large permease [Alphaproteobacteria bacterium]